MSQSHFIAHFDGPAGQRTLEFAAPSLSQASAAAKLLAAADERILGITESEAAPAAPALRPDAIVATWITGDSLHGYELHANGNLVERHRDSIGTVWSPPKVIASQRLSQTLPAFQDFLAGLTTRRA